MPDTYLIIVVLLFLLAVSDLVVGVSNDAVNFLNSAVGSRVAPRNIIMVVVSLGIFVGATFSSGMMEVARSGIFNPQFFVFGEIMVIFLAVMLTDIILLDLFNTLGLPTSTTVSIVFELLGAAVLLSLIKILNQGEGIQAIATYINSSTAILIISGIFLSIGIAFVTGAVVQYISRLIFSFRYQQRHRLVGALWSGLASASLTYFLLFKGIKGASFVSDSFISWVGENTLLLLAGSFVVWTLAMWVLALRGVNVFRLVVLYGTFALAMAFAGNDLVNFIGVPVAGFESYLSWHDSGMDPFGYSMEVLTEPVRTNSYLLMAAGLVMIITLWFSKKARSVTETEVNLGRQSEGQERFSPNHLSRGIVRVSSSAASYAQQLFPDYFLKRAKTIFETTEEQTADKPAFDLIRASVNLTMASTLIAFATSLKLPLSTTYVSFMVAMGTSLADKAWGRDSAVYRVAGVLNVVGGWFATAIIAFLTSALFAFLIYHFKFTAIVLLVAAAALFIYRSFAYHRTKEKKKELRKAGESDNEAIVFNHLIHRFSQRISELLSTLENTYSSTVAGLVGEDLDKLAEAKKSITQLISQNDDLQYSIFSSIKRIHGQEEKSSRMFLYMFDLEQDILQSAELIVKVSNDYTRNMMSPLKSSQIRQLEEVSGSVSRYLNEISTIINSGPDNSYEHVRDEKRKILQLVEQVLNHQVEGVKSKQYGARNSQLMFRILLETKDMVAVAARFVKLYNQMYVSDQEAPGQKYSG